MSDAPASDDEIGVRRRSRLEAGLECVDARAGEMQHLGYAARDFVMCGLPFKRPRGGRTYRRQNGEMLLEIEGSARFGLPYGQDRLIAIWLTTAFFAAGRPADDVIRFRCASDILRAFGLATKGGEKLTRLRERILRVYYATYHVSYIPRSAADRSLIRTTPYRIMDEVRMNLADETRRHSNQYSLWQDSIKLDAKFAAELRAGGRVPIDLETVKALKECSPALDLYIWQAWRSFRLARDRKSPTSIPIFGESGLMAQLGSEASSPKKIKSMLRRWQAEVSRVWQDCPNFLDRDCERIFIHPGDAIATDQRIPELPGVSMAPPPLREVGALGGSQLVLIRETGPSMPGADSTLADP